MSLAGEERTWTQLKYFYFYFERNTAQVLAGRVACVFMASLLTEARPMSLANILRKKATGIQQGD
jgi:hypothetical protein